MVPGELLGRVSLKWKMTDKASDEAGRTMGEKWDDEKGEPGESMVKVTNFKRACS